MTDTGAAGAGTGPDSHLRHYLTITAGYWAFTVTDGAIRMLVVLHFHLLGYSPFEVAMLFLFYEFFGVVTNLVGGWLGARVGLRRTLTGGMLLQVCALLMLTVPDAWLGVAYVMAAQALSGIAKDLNKMSAKAGVKTVLPDSGPSADARLFRWVAMLTGSKNALKGAGFFVGAGLLEWLGFRAALFMLAAVLFLVFLAVALSLPEDLGRTKAKPKFSQVFSKSAAVNRLSVARLFLFAARDVWLVVALPVFLYEVLGWSFPQVGAYLALWVMGYGVVQTLAPRLVSSGSPHVAARIWAALLTVIPVGLVWALQAGASPDIAVVAGLAVFGFVFAINSATHSFLILAYSTRDQAVMDVAFYYMANAGGRLAGTVLSGAVYQFVGLTGCLLVAAGLIAVSTIAACLLPAPESSVSKSVM